ncbi:MAG: putative flippase AglR [Candidatus Methanophagaceae archaeon]|nr:MAG: putative flippase AglR [Methanophagales archaeon]KAF5436470.1 Membrane protein involved in the export of O-antigen and teichoic acid [Methanophagales archaeon]
MNSIQRIAKNTAALFAAQVVVSILGLVLSIFIARSLGDVIFGKYSFALAFTAIFSVFSDLGYGTLLIREVARDKSQASKYLNNVLGLRALLSLVIFAFIVITINVMGYPADTKNLVYLFGIYTLIVSFSAVFKLTFRAFEKMEYEAGITIFTNIIRVSLGLLVLFLGYGLIELAFVFLFSGVFELLISFLVCERRFVKPKIELDFEFWKSTIKIALPIGMLSIFALVYIRIDTIMLSMMKGDAVVGWYTAAYGLVLVFKPIPQLFMNALFPLMSGYFVSSKDSLKKVYEKSFKYLFILGLPLAVGITLLADRFIILFYGQQFYPSIIALQILAWDTLLLFICMPVNFILVSMNKQNQMATVAGGCALINIILNLILIPHFSYIGAGVATIVTETILFGLYFYLVSKYLSVLPLHKIIAKPLIACSAMAFFINFCSEVNLAVLVISSAVLYFVVFYLIKGFTEEDRKLIGKMVH